MLPLRWNGPAQFKESLGNRHHSLLPIRDIHFKGTGIEGLSDRMANPAYVTVLMLVALFLLGIACINYINLTTARAAGRSKEVGVRKVVGAGQRHMVGQFLTETYLMVAAAFSLSVGLLQLVLPGFNEFSGKALTLSFSTDPIIWAGAVGVAFLAGLMAGLYPSLYLARLRPAILFKNVLPGSWWEFSLRKGLVIAQFGLSALLMISTGVVWRQMRYLENKDLGFTHDQLIVVDINSQKVRRGFATIKAGYAQIPGVEAVSVSTRVPGEWKNLPQVTVQRAGADANAEGKPAWFIGADEDFLQTYQVPLLSGRDFAPNGTDSAAVILNKSAASMIGITEATGQWIDIPSFSFGSSQNALDQPFKVQVIGIVQDFHFQSLREKLRPW
ncbi:MAG: FtsX-like permease family protein [Lewinellaceae bacterium]|nr:FtsX-like permease family protein [Lewinellaceae bacterium]